MTYNSRQRRIRPPRAKSDMPGDAEAHRAVVEDQTESIARFRADGTFTFVNEIYCRFFGLSREELIGSRWQPRTVEEDLPLIEARLSSLAPDNPVAGIDHRVYAADGQVRWMHFVYRAFFDSDGRLAEVQSVGRDITGRKAVEERLRESEHRFMVLFRSSPSPTALIRLEDEHIQDVNDAFLSMVGWNRDELVGRTSRDLLLWPDPVQRVAFFRQVQEQEAVSGFESTFRRKSGEIGTALLSATLVELDGRRLILATGLDQTERKQAEQALQESEARLHTVIDNSQDGINLLDLQTGQYVLMSPAQMRLTGFTQEEINHISADEAFQRVHPEDRRISVEQQKAVAEGRESGCSVEYRWKVKSGEYRWFSDSRSLVRDSQGKAISLVGISRDITERKQMEQALAEAQAELAAHAVSLEQTVRQRTAELVAAYRMLKKEMEARVRLEREILIRVKQERRRLGRELHDGLSQLLTGAKFKAGLLKRQMERSMPVSPEEIGTLEDDLNQALEQARDMGRGTHPSGLVARGLVAALEDLARGITETYQLDCTCLSPSPMSIRDQDTALHLYRIAQEAVQNAVQHGKAKRIVIRLDRCDGFGRLEVLDDGRGFSSSEPHNGMGLDNMKARAEAMQGRLEILPASEGGTLVRCIWPSGTNPSSLPRPTI